MASQLGVAVVQLEKSRLRLIFPEEVGPSPTQIQQLVQKSSVDLEFDVDERLSVETFIRATDEQERLTKAKEIIQEMV